MRDRANEYRGAAARRARRARLVWRRHGLLLIGGFLVSCVLIAALFADWISPYSPYELDVAVMLEGPSPAHWLGTDELGRDVLSRAIHAARISVEVALVAVGVGLIGGTVIGIIAAYFGGLVDMVLMRFMELLFSFPAILLAVILMASLGTSILNAMIAIGIIFIPGFSRLARAATQNVLRQQYSKRRVQSACPTGGSCCARSCPTWSRPCWSKRRSPSPMPCCSNRRSAFLPRRAAAGALLGQHAEPRPRLHGAGAVARYRARHGDVPVRARFQSARRRVA